MHIFRKKHASMTIHATSNKTNTIISNITGKQNRKQKRSNIINLLAIISENEMYEY